MSHSTWMIASAPLWLAGGLLFYFCGRVMLKYFALPLPVTERHGWLFFVASMYFAGGSTALIKAAEWAGLLNQR